MYLDILNTTLGLILLLFAPGFSLTLALFPKREIDLFERISISIVSSISLNVVLVFFMNYFLGFPITHLTILAGITLMIFVFTAIYFIRIRELSRIALTKYGNKRIDDKRIDTKKILQASCILVLIALTSLLTYNIHMDYAYPFISDEWHHIAQGVQIVDKGGIYLQNPYYNEPVESPEVSFFEIGFHVFLAELFLLTGCDPVLFYVYLPAIFSAIVSFILFTFTWKISGNFHTGLLSMLFFAGLKSSINVLGPWFFVPLTMGFAFIYLLFYLITTGLEKNSFVSLALSAFILLALALIHPWSAGIILPVVVIYLLMRPALISKNIPGLGVLFLAPISSFIYVFGVLWQGSFIETLQYLTENFLIRGLEIPVTRVGDLIFLLNFYGMLPTLVAFAGIICIILPSITKNKGKKIFCHTKNCVLYRKIYTFLYDEKQEKILLAWIFPMSFIILLFQLTGVTLIVPYERIFYYTLLCLVPLSATGLFEILKIIDTACLKKEMKRVYPSALTFICIMVVVFSLFSNYYAGKSSLYRLIDEPTYAALKWLESEGGRYNVVLSRPRISSAIYPATRNYVVSVNPAQIGFSFRGLYDNMDFFMSDCGGKRWVAEKYGVDYILMRGDDRINCEFLREIYSEGGVYVYEVESEEENGGGN